MFIHQKFTVPNLIETGYLAYIRQLKLITYNITKTELLYILQLYLTSWKLQSIYFHLLNPISKQRTHQDQLLYNGQILRQIITTTIFSSLIQKHFNIHINQQKPFNPINIPLDKLNICLASQLSIKQLSPIFNKNKNIYIKTHLDRKAHHWAAISGNLQLFHLLLQHKFDPYQQDSFGFNTYHYILSNPNNPIYKSITQNNQLINTNNYLIRNNLTFQTKPNHHQVIIIGAGAASIGAAITLSKAGLPYIVLQARQRIGGRILSKPINQVQMDLGASWVHSCSKNNAVWKQAKKLNWNTKKTLPYTDSIILSQMQQQLSQKDIHHSIILSKTYFEHVKQHGFTLKDDVSIEQAGRKFYQSYIAVLDPIKKSVVDMLINMTEQYNAAVVQKLSAKFYDQQQDTGTDWLPQQSYYKLLQAISKSVQFQKKVYFKKQVKQIIYNNDTQYCEIITNEGQIFYAKRIISSLPLGILKTNKVNFTPPLPQQHQQCIEKLGWGIMNKIILSVDKPFWKQNPSWLRIASQQKGKFPSFYNFSTQNKHILCCFLTDNFAIKTSLKTDQQIINELLQLLKKVSQKQQINIIDYTITRWDQDPYSLGSYTHFAVGSNMKTSKKLRQNVNQKLWIVGQHCYGQHIGCAHGAFQTGVWASQEILTLIKRVNIKK